MRTLVPEPFCQLADQTRWRQRRGNLDPFEFLVALSFGPWSALRQTLSSQAQSLSEPVTRQAVDQRRNTHTVERVQGALPWLCGLKS